MISQQFTIKAVFINSLPWHVSGWSQAPLWSHFFCSPGTNIAKAPESMPIRIVIADDHALFLEMLSDIIIRRSNAYKLIAGAKDGDEAMELVTRHQPDILLLDYNMPRLRRLSTFCTMVRRQSPATRIILLTGFTEEKIALEAAASRIRGYVLKGATVADLLAAISTVQAGGIWTDAHLPQDVSRAFLRRRGKRTGKLLKLTRQELRILSLVAQGQRNNEIASRLYISGKTVKNHLTRIFAKLKLTNRVQATNFFYEKKSGM
jgi:two-component system, NarL family, response regulator DegU